METIVVKSEYFNPTQTLECGQVFRYKPYKNGYTVISRDKICYIHSDLENTYIETEFKDYFYNYFDLNTDYSKIVSSAQSYNIEILTNASRESKGIRILRQDPEETLFSFIISQNNFIKRISNTIEKTCELVGEKLTSPFGDYYAFPTAKALSMLNGSDYKALGYGYRANYIKELACKVVNGYNVKSYYNLDYNNLVKELTSNLGVGEKVANCVTLFGFNKTESFPVDTWIEKIYREDLLGTLTDRKKITKELTQKFGVNSGYYQQYLFYYKRLKSL